MRPIQGNAPPTATHSNNTPQPEEAQPSHRINLDGYHVPRSPTPAQLPTRPTSHSFRQSAANAGIMTGLLTALSGQAMTLTGAYQNNGTEIITGLALTGVGTSLYAGATYFDHSLDTAQLPTTNATTDDPNALAIELTIHSQSTPRLTLEQRLAPFNLSENTMRAALDLVTLDHDTNPPPLELNGAQALAIAELLRQLAVTPVTDIPPALAQAAQAAEDQPIELVRQLARII